MGGVKFSPTVYMGGLMSRIRLVDVFLYSLHGWVETAVQVGRGVATCIQPTQLYRWAVCGPIMTHGKCTIHVLHRYTVTA